MKRQVHLQVYEVPLVTGVTFPEDSPGIYLRLRQGLISRNAMTQRSFPRLAGLETGSRRQAGTSGLTVKWELCTSRHSSNGTPFWKGMLIFLSSAPHWPFCFVLQTTYPPSSNRGLKWKAMLFSLKPACRFTANLGRGKPGWLRHSSPRVCLSAEDPRPQACDPLAGQPLGGAWASFCLTQWL